MDVYLSHISPDIIKSLRGRKRLEQRVVWRLRWDTTVSVHVFFLIKSTKFVTAVLVIIATFLELYFSYILIT